MRGFVSSIERATLENSDFRKVVYTGEHLQVVLMNLKAGESIGEEVHTDTDQFFRLESGEATCKIDNNEYRVGPGDTIVVPAGARHNVINTGNSELRLYTIYAPPHHEDGLVRITKEDAMQHPAPFDGRTTERSSMLERVEPF